MAKLLYEHESSRKCVSAVRKHMRRCKLIPKASKYSSAIDPHLKALKDKIEVRISKAEIREDAYDETMFFDSVLGGEIKDLYLDCEKYDRHFPGELVMKKVFPQGRFTLITSVNYEKELELAEGLALRTESLGKDHQLFPYVEVIRQKKSQSMNSIKAYKDALFAEKIAEAEEKIAQTALRSQYEYNYLDARKDLGKALAETLFPKSMSRKKPADIVPQV